jgi:hypothetical protein
LTDGVPWCALAKGHDAVRASLARWKAEWDDYQLMPEEFVDRGTVS